MKQFVRGAWRLLRMTSHVFKGVWLAVLVIPKAPAEQQRARIQAWSQEFLRVVGIELRCQGQALGAAKLVVANHVSWLDIVAVNAVHPVRFVGKADLKHWPLVGQLATAAGTLYIERERKRDAMRVVHHVAQSLRDGDTVAVFPEGTTSDGHGLLPFHANLLQAAIATETPVQALVLRFSDARHAVSPAAAYVGDTHLLTSVWRVVSAKGLVANLQWMPALASAQTERRELSGQLRGQILTQLEQSS